MYSQLPTKMAFSRKPEIERREQLFSQNKPFL